VPTIAELEICARDEYLGKASLSRSAVSHMPLGIEGGLMDFTGELNRFAVLRATARDVKTVQECRDVCDKVRRAWICAVCAKQRCPSLLPASVRRSLSS
jgi:hypothetical protein